VYNVLSHVYMHLLVLILHLIAYCMVTNHLKKLLVQFCTSLCTCNSANTKSECITRL
jgi:hypothetical protein